MLSDQTKRDGTKHRLSLRHISLGLLALSLISLAPAANAQFCYHHPCPGEQSDDVSSYEQQQRPPDMLQFQARQLNQQLQYQQWQRDQYDRDLWRLWLQNHWNDRR